jgi:hypothetical protein
LELLLAEEGLTAEAGLALTPRADPAAPGPLSFAQQRLWFLDQFEPGGSAYNVPGALRLSGALDAVALRRAFLGLGERQEVLRTVFVAEGDAPVATLVPGLTPADLGVRRVTRTRRARASRLRGDTPGLWPCVLL